MVKTVIYIRAGRVIYKKRKHLDGFLNPFKDNPFNMVVTEVEITRQDRSMESTHKGDLSSDSNFEEYSVNVKAQKPSRYDQPLTAILQMRSLSKKVAENEANAEAWLYARSAFLYYIACFMVWVRHSSLMPPLCFPSTKTLSIGPCNSRSDIYLHPSQQLCFWLLLCHRILCYPARNVQLHCLLYHVEGRVSKPVLEYTKRHVDVG